MVDYIITYNILFFRYDNSNNKENKGEKMKNKKLILPIGEEDIRLFEQLVIYNGEEFNWTFKTECGELIDIEFIKDREEG